MDIVLFTREQQQYPSLIICNASSVLLFCRGVPGEVHYSNNGYQVNSDLELEDETDAVPYGEFRNLQGMLDSD